jgi:biopolymer transport protein ExbD
MYRQPSARRRKKAQERLNLIPILDSVFIFIFFLLLSANFLKVFEIASDVPIVSDAQPPKDKKKPLALTITIYKGSISISTGVPSRVVRSFKKQGEKYNLEDLHKYLITLKKKHLGEENAIFEPKFDLEYQDLVEIMDAVRTLRKTDEAIYRKTKDGIEEKVQTLFSKIVFGNIMS